MNDKTTTTPTNTKKKSSVRHTRAIQRDRSKRPISAPADEEMVKRLEEIVKPATEAQVAYYHSLGLRSRKLTLPIMMALVLNLIWQQVGGVSELTRLLNTGGVLWVPVMAQVTQQALSSRMQVLPAELFLRVLQSVLPVLAQRWLARKRPLPLDIAWVHARYSQVLACDGSTLDALLRKVGLLREQETNPLAGRMLSLLDVVTHLPTHIWYEEDAQAHDQSFLDKVLGVLKPGNLLLFDLGFTNFAFYLKLTELGVFFVTRAKSNLSYQVALVLCATAAVHDQLIWIGTDQNRQLLRLVQVLYKGKWYCYLTNELDTTRLPVQYVVAIYWQRWRIEDAYNIVKRLLGLAFFFGGGQNAVCLQLWATWLLYAILVDLSDAVASELNKPFARISMEMVYRSLYFFKQARSQGETDSLVTYLAKHAATLGILKRKPDKPSILLSLILTFDLKP